MFLKPCALIEPLALDLTGGFGTNPLSSLGPGMGIKEGIAM